VRVYTAHVHPTAPPVLVAEGFAWGALIFGPLWLFVQRAWIAGVLALAAVLAILALTGGWATAVLLAALAWAFGLWGHDLRRWSLARRGYVFVHVVAAPDSDAALLRLLARRPDLIGAAVA
jgi:O-antigen ligase